MVFVFTKNEHDQSEPKRSHFPNKYGMDMIIIRTYRTSCTTFWFVWNNDLTTKQNFQMIKSEERDEQLRW